VKREKKAPPLNLSAGEIMVAAIVAEMKEEGVEPDSKETQLLATASKIVNHLTALEKLIETDGEMLDVGGVKKLHPALSEHRQTAISLTKVLQAIVIGDTQSGSVKNPQKVKAANVRWANVASRNPARANLEVV
jgi:hypothetical protein